VTAAYLFWKFLEQPTFGRAVPAGLLLGLAELTKMTWIILFLLWPAIWIACRFRGWKDWQSTGRFRELSQVAVIVGVAIVVLNAGYLFVGTMTKLREFEFVSQTLTGESGHRLVHHGNRFVGTWLGEVPVPVPKDYVLGLDVTKGAFDLRRPGYLAGEFREGGWWYYYLYALAIKVPVGIWLLAFLAAAYRLRHNGDRPGWRHDFVLLAPLFVVLALVSSNPSINRHVRYALPIAPFAFIWISRVAQSFERSEWGFVIPAVGVIAWSSASSLSVYPHCGSYFNELAGGPIGGHAHLISSNIDYGQDLLELKRWLANHPEAHPLHLAYYGNFDPCSAGIDFSLPPNDLKSGWYAISVSLLRGEPASVPDGRGGWTSPLLRRFSEFLKFKPVGRAGFSIYIYHVTDADIESSDEPYDGTT
jgi:hypothetical protein